MEYFSIMRCLKYYKDKEKAKAYAQRCKDRYYGESRKKASNPYKRWESWEIKKVLEHSITDKELANELGRSVQAIQQCRNKFKAASI